MPSLHLLTTASSSKCENQLWKRVPEDLGLQYILKYW